MSREWLDDIDALRARLVEVIDSTGQGDPGREVALDTVEELGAIVAELHAQNEEIAAGRSSIESERARYRSLFDAVPDGYVVTDATGVISEANRTACQLLGHSYERLVGKPLAVYVADDGKRAFYHHLRRLQRTGPGSHLSVNLLIHDHEIIPANLRAVFGDDQPADDTEIRWLIHDRRDELATEELRHSEERLRALFETTRVGIVMCDADGLVVFSNAAADRLLDRPRRNVDLLEWMESVHPDDVAGLRAMVDRARQEGEPGMVRHRLLNGEDHRWVEHDVAPIVGSDETVEGFVIALTDVSAEHQAMEHLQESRDFTAAIVDTVGASIVALDTDWTIQMLNRAGEALTGYDAEEIIGRDVVDVFVSTAHQAIARESLQALSTREANTLEVDWTTKSGRTRRVSWTNTTLRNPDGSLRLIVGSGIDVTDQRDLQERLARSARLDSLGRFAAGIAHDFNNTLSTVQLRADRLGGRHDDASTRSDLEAIQRTIDHTKKLTSDLLAFSRGSREPAQLLDVSAVCNEMSALLGDLVGPDIDLVLELTDQPTSAAIDRGRLEQIITNLAINARDAMPDGGRLTVVTAVDVMPAGSHLAVRSDDDTRAVRVSVADEGVGIEPTDLPHVFDPYFTTKESGTGLGLSSSYGAVTRAGGWITVDSSLGDGTTFTFWLPTGSTPGDDAADDGPTDDGPTEGGPTDDRPPGRTEHRRRPRILAVDDDTELRSVLVDELERHGFDVVGAEDADDALSAMDERIDLLLTDVDLPGLDGIRLAEEIRRRLPGLPVILISGAPLDRDGSGPDTRGLELIRKPFALAELAHSIWARLEPMATS